MGDIRAVFFWLSGVFTPPFLSLAAQALNRASGRAINPLALPQYAALVEALATGQIEDTEFCERLGESAGIDSSPEALRDGILDGVSTNQGTLAVTQLLPEHLQRWLVVDLPAAWFERFGGLPGVRACFALERTVFLPASRLPRLIPDVFYRLAYQAQLPLEECLLIDASTRRAVQALNHGLSTELYVDNRRLERMFVLRGLIDRPRPFHRPELS